MSIIANVRAGAGDFEFGSLLEGAPGITVRLERMVPIGDAFVPYVWLAHEALTTVETLLDEDPHVSSYRVVDTIDSEALVRLEWAADMDGLLVELRDADVVILQGTGTPDGWSFQLRFPTRQALSTFYQRCLDNDIHIHIESVHNPGFTSTPDVAYRITDLQRETLLTAFEAGYFDVPRSTNLVELAERLDISDTAASQRLRRGITTLLEETLVEK